MGIAMQADPTLGEQPGGLQAPHVFTHEGVYYMVYGDFMRICLARSFDGKTFTRAARQRAAEPVRRAIPEHARSDGAASRQPVALLLHRLADPDAVCSRVLPHLGGLEVLERTDVRLRRRHPRRHRLRSTPSARSCSNATAGSICSATRSTARPRRTRNTRRAIRSTGVGHDRYRIGTLPIAAPEMWVHTGTTTSLP